MIRSLAQDSAAFPAQCDCLVVGAGIAGLITATRLTAAGKRVVVVESGGERQDTDEHELNRVDMAGQNYEGARLGRFRCLGGTSTRWGGAMIPFLAADIANAQWPVSMDDLVPYLAEVEALFRLPDGPYDLPAIMIAHDGAAPTHLARLGKWPAFGKRNVASLLRHQIEAQDGPEVWTDANVTGFSVANGARVDAVRVAAPDGTLHHIDAAAVYICAGAIESTRLALLLDRTCDQRLLEPHRVVGRYFHDHISSTTGTIEDADRVRLNRLAGFRFEGEGMRNLRFELAQSSPLRTSQPPQFTHLHFAGSDDDGFAALRELFRAVQQRRLPDPAIVGSLVRHAPWLVRAVWWRFVERRVLAPAGCAIDVVSVIEQQPRADNRISLSGDNTDRFGVPLAVINWRVSDDDRATLRASAQAFANAWHTSSLTALGRVQLREDDRIDAQLDGSGGIYHPCGSTRIGATPTDGVVDADCRVFGLDNVRIFSTSVLPTSGGANPTMMMLLIALRSIDRALGWADAN